MERPGRTAGEVKEAPLVRRATREREGSRGSLVHPEREGNRPMTSSLKDPLALLDPQELLVQWVPLVLRVLKVLLESDTTEPTCRRLRLWCRRPIYQMMGLL